MLEQNPVILFKPQKVLKSAKRSNSHEECFSCEGKYVQLQKRERLSLQCHPQWKKVRSAFLPQWRSVAKVSGTVRLSRRQGNLVLRKYLNNCVGWGSQCVRCWVGVSTSSSHHRIMTWNLLHCHTDTYFVNVCVCACTCVFFSVCFCIFIPILNRYTNK